METAESILSALSQPVLVVDGALRPLIANPAFCKMLGLDAKRASRRVIDGFVSGDGCRPPLREILASFSGSAGDAVARHVGGRELWVMDRGGDRINLRAPLLDRGLRFLFRLVGARSLEHNGRNLMPLVTAAMCFAACVLDHDARLRVMAGFVERAAKRLFGIPDFKYYALADGLRALFDRHPGKPAAPGPRNAPRQTDLFAYDSP